jgi:type IV pilus assembly protein PilX
MRVQEIQRFDSARRAAIEHAAGCAASRQRGVVLFIALIVLVAMTLAGIAITRSVDTGNLVAGNMAFKQSTLSAADNGIAQAFQWLTTTINTPGTYATLEQDITAKGYHAAVSEPADWTDDAVWNGQSLVLGTDAAGNSVDYIIQRMCDGTGAYSSGVNCAQTPRVGGESGNSQAVGGTQFNSPPMVYYRVTVRVRGARETLSIVQSMVGLQQ